jgi:hypothetical protein
VSILDVSQATTYTIGMDDSFSLSFKTRWTTGGDTGDCVQWGLFYTIDDALDAVVYTKGSPGSFSNTNILFGGSAALVGSSTDLKYQLNSFNTDPVADPNAVGRKLYLVFSPGPNFELGDFQLMDEVNLTVVPEPATLSVLGTFGLLGLMRRRRPMQ